MTLVVKTCLPVLRNRGFDPWVRKIPWRIAWQPTPVFLPGEFYGQRSLAGYGPQGHKETETTYHAHMHEEKHLIEGVHSSSTSFDASKKNFCACRSHLPLSLLEAHSTIIFN